MAPTCFWRPYLFCFCLHCQANCTFSYNFPIDLLSFLHFVQDPSILFYPLFLSPFIMDLPVYYPDFWDLPDHDFSSVKADEWMTIPLKEEISSHYPDSGDIGEDRARCKESFETHAAELFPKNRIFASFAQLRVSVELFLKAWGASSSHGSSRLTCFYGKPFNKARPSVVEADKQRNRAPSLKHQLCPFKILYSFQGKQGFAKKGNIYYQVKITTVNYEHTCELSPNSCRLALRGAGKLTPNLGGLQDILSLLSEHPNLDHKVLRSLLQKYVPFYQALDGSYIRNFRLRALSFIHADHELTMSEARALTSKSRSAADELASTDNPIFATNFKRLLQKTMQEDGDTWEALKYLRNLKLEVPGFDFRIQYDDKGRPTAICWMLPHMRTNLLRYADVLFLDTMMKQFNNLGWPYIGPTVKDGEMKIRQVAECIAIEETLDIYQFVVETMANIEPRWTLSKLRIIFADQFITMTLLDNLGIAATCTLRCDYHHIVKEVWPTQFGVSVFHTLKPYLTRMLLSKTKEEYILSYEIAMSLIEDDPLKGSYVQKIFNNHQCFGGYFLRQIPGNLRMMGDAPAEQNHASVAAHLGQGANWTISEHVRQLIERQNTLEKSFHHQDNKLYTSSLNFRSERIGIEKKNEEEAKRNLTSYSFQKLFLRSVELSKELSMETNPSGDVALWPHYKDRDGVDTVIIKTGERCSCHSRIAFLYQCGHELSVDIKFDLGKYNDRWLMTRVFHHQHPLMCSMPTSINPVSSEPIMQTGEVNPQVMNESQHDDDSTIPVSDQPESAFNKNMNYSFALGRCSQMCKSAGHDKVALASVVSLVDEVT